VSYAVDRNRVQWGTPHLCHSEGAEWLLANFRREFPSLKLTWVDQSYKDWMVEDAQTHYAITFEHVHKPKDHEGFAV
jgi:hypothetical protein